jgi:hypothetical protein
LALKDGPGGQYSVPFDAALLIFEALADHPWIHLLHIEWNPNSASN